MKNRAIVFAAMAALVVMLISGCASVGRGDLNMAREALDANRPDEALVYATEALLQDPEFDRAKGFLKENAADGLAQIQGFLAKAKTSNDPKTVEREFETYGNLVAFYANLEEIGLPLVKGKKLFGLIKGWEWSTPIKDYQPALADARVKARSVFLEAGFAAVDKGELNNAESMLKKVVTRFAIDGSEEQTQDKIDISAKFADWASQIHGSQDPDRLLAGLKAYDIALDFNDQNAAASDGLAQMKLELSDVYLALGLQEEKKDTIESLQGAISFFKKSLEYNKSNEEASAGIPRARHRIAVLYTDDGVELVSTGKIDDMIAGHELFEKALEWDEEYARASEKREEAVGLIAEYYYQEGNRLGESMNDDKSLKAAIAAYDSAQEWIKGYKDSDTRERRLYVSRQVIILVNKLGQTQKEFDRTNERVVYLSGQVNKGHKGINDIFYVADKVIQLEQQMRTIKQVMSPMSAIPYVGPVFSVTGTALDKAHSPVKKCSDKVKRVQKPFITPARTSIGKVKASVDQIVGTMADIKAKLGTVQATAAKLNGCVQNVDDPATLKEVEGHVKEINKALDELNDGLDTVNDVQDQVEGSMKSLASSVSVVSKVSGGVKKIMSPLDKIDSVTSKIGKVLDKKIKIPLVGSFTVGEAVESSTGVVKKAAKKLLDPVLDKLNISIPSVPGIDELESILDKVEGYYAEIADAEKKIDRARGQILAVPEKLNGELNSIVSKTQCKF